MFVEFLWVLLLGSLLGLELIGKVPPTLHTPLMPRASRRTATSSIAYLRIKEAVISGSPYGRACG